ncbi:MAG TPA: DUF169 domain-containing protein [Terriglobales bacterium]|nr:DUF169 domain-containing protein [Terriglobales bacterium]
MLDYKRFEQILVDSLELKREPVAIAFREMPVEGVSKFEGSEPSSCSYWRLAAEGKTFYTVPSDHYNCAVGSHTHNIPLPPERQQELSDTIGFMTGIGYIRMEDIAQIPQLKFQPRVIIYAPLGETPVDPDVVLLSGRAGRLMLALEAAIRAGVASAAATLGRPTCMAIPAAMASGAVASAGCVGNRVYTGLTDDELYMSVPGSALPQVIQALETILAANVELLGYHRARRQALASE